MTARLTIDAAGRIVIPKTLRDELDLAPGDTLEVETTGEKITLRPTRGTVPLAKEKGVWVFRTGHPISQAVTNDVLDQVWTERDRNNIGVKD